MPEEWVVWNRYCGTKQEAVINDLRPWQHGASGTLDGLEYDDIGRISVNDLINKGYVEAFGYYIMSPEYWRKHERQLRQDYAKHVLTEGSSDEVDSALLLGFSLADRPTKAEIVEAYRIAVKSTHPDKGDGDADLFREVTKARDELLSALDAIDDIPF
jgi:hypothetical protein